MLKRGMIGFYAEMQIINWYSVEGGFTLSSEFILLLFTKGPWDSIRGI